MEIFAATADERRALADTFDELTLAESRAPSLCHAWTVHDVAAHLVMVLEVGVPQFMRALMRARGSFDRANDRLTRTWSERPLGELSQALRDQADSRFTPPGAGPEGPLTDVLVHGMDVRLPLGLSRDIPLERVKAALGFLADLKPVPGQPGPTLVARHLLDGLRLQATDMDWSHGTGRVVAGRGQDLLLAVTGRMAGAQKLTGPGVPALLSRLRAGQHG